MFKKTTNNKDSLFEAGSNKIVTQSIDTIRAKVIEEFVNSHIVIMPEEMTLNEQPRKCIVSNHNIWRERWDYMIIFMAVYNCLFLPVDLAFKPPVSTYQI